MRTDQKLDKETIIFLFIFMMQLMCAHRYPLNEQAKQKSNAITSKYIYQRLISTEQVD